MEKAYPIDTGALNQIYNGIDEKTPALYTQMHMSNEVNPEILELAVNLAIKKYDCFAVTLFENNGQPWFKKNNNNVPVHKRGDSSHDFGSDSVNQFLFYVEYFENIIFVSFHHVLSDGCGFMEFIKYILLCYLKESGCIKEIGEYGNLDIKDNADPFGLYGNIDSKTEFFIKRKNEFVIPHEMEYRKSSTQYLYILRFNIKELLIEVKKSEATVLPVMVGIVCRALHGAYNVGNNTIVGTCGVNLRQFYNSKTIKNFSQSVPIAFPARELKMSIEDQATCQRGMMDLCFQKENTDYSIAFAYQRFLQNMNSAKYFDEIADQQKWDEIRKKDEGKSAYFLSYFGKLDLMKEAEPYLKDIFIYVPGTRSPLTMSALSCGDIMNISFIQSFESDEFVTQMKKCLEEINIDATLSYCGPQLFDQSIVTETIMDTD